MIEAPQVDHLLPGLGVIVWEFDWDADAFTYVSPAVETVFGYSRADWLEPGFWRRSVHPLDAEWAIQYHRAAHEGGRPSVFNHRMIGPDGGPVWVRGHSEPQNGGRSCGVLLRVASSDARAGDRSLFAGITPHVSEVDGDGVILWMSRSALQFHGLTLGEAVGRSVFELMPEDQRAKWQLAYETDMSAGEVELGPETLDMVSSEGVTRVMRVMCSPVGTPGAARPHSALLAMYDVSDVGARVSDSGARVDQLQSIVDVFGDPLLIVDADGTCLDARVPRGAGGVPMGQAAGLSVAEAHSSMTEMILLDAVAEARAAGSVVAVEIDSVTAGVRNDSEIRVVALGDGEFAFTVRDINERRERERRILSSEARLRSLLDGIPLGLHLWRVEDGDDLVLAGSNQAADQILGIDHVKLLGQSIAEAFPPAAAAGLDEVYRDIALHGGSYFNSHVEYSDGEVEGVFDVRAFWSGPGETAVLFEEVTERERIATREAAYQARLRALTDELASFEDRERRRFADELHDRVTQLLVVTRMQLRQAQEEPDRTRRGECVESALCLLDQSIRESRQLITDLHPPVLSELGLPVAIEWLVEQHGRFNDVAARATVSGDRAVHVPEEIASLVFRSARELLANVARHADAAGVEVVLDVRPAAIVLEVSDDGQGFDGARIEHHGADGGFGLFSIRERTKHAGGDFRVGPSPSGGACVTVRVPLR